MSYVFSNRSHRFAWPTHCRSSVVIENGVLTNWVTAYIFREKQNARWIVLQHAIHNGVPPYARIVNWARPRAINACNHFIYVTCRLYVHRLLFHHYPFPTNGLANHVFTRQSVQGWKIFSAVNTCSAISNQQKLASNTKLRRQSIMSNLNPKEYEELRKKLMDANGSFALWPIVPCCQHL